MRIIVTGVASFIGRVVTKGLLTGGYRVFAVVRLDSPGLPQLEMLAPEAEGKSGRRRKRLTFLPFTLRDIRKLESCPALVSSSALKPHSVPKGVVGPWFHLGWEGAGSINRQDPHAQARSTGYALGSLHIVARLGCARFLFYGSQVEYSIADGIMEEEILCHSVPEYGKNKLEVCRRAGEDAKALGTDYIHVRIFSVYGPGDHPWSLVSTCLDTLPKEDRTEFGACTQQWNLLYVRDAARALAGLPSTKIPAGVCDVAGKDTRFLKSFVGQIYRLYGEKNICGHGERSPNAEGAVPLASDIRKLKEAAGFVQEISFGNRVREMIGIYKENCL